MLLLVEIIIIMKGWIITLCCVTSLCFSGIFKKFMFSELKKSALVWQSAFNAEIPIYPQSKKEHFAVENGKWQINESRMSVSWEWGAALSWRWLR